MHRLEWPNVRRYLKQLRYWDTDEIEEGLFNLGCDILGAGASGIAIEYADCVIKVFRADDWGYRAFADIALNCESRYLPKIYWYEQINKHCMAVALEKLAPIGSGDEDYRFLQRFFYYASTAQTDDAEIIELRNLIQVTKENIKPDDCGISLDVHSQNFMRRGEQLVVTDPLCC